MTQDNTASAEGQLADNADHDMADVLRFCGQRCTDLYAGGATMHKEWRDQGS